MNMLSGVKSVPSRVNCSARRILSVQSGNLLPWVISIPRISLPILLPNLADGTVDIEYQLEERSNDQLEVSGGWGGYGFVGTIGLRFSNFSARKILDLKAWRPVPTGDGQTLSVRAQSNGKYYQAYNLSFVEPWFGGKKPNSFSTSFYYTVTKTLQADFGDCNSR